MPAALLDPSGQILAINAAWRASASALLAEVLTEGANFFQVAGKRQLFASDAESLQVLLAVLSGANDTCAVELPAENLRLVATAVFEGEVRGLLLTVQPLQTSSALAERENQTRRLESLAALAGGVAHDFNNLLTTILGYTHLALADLPADTPVRDFLVQVEKSGRRAANLTQRLLVYAGRNVFNFKPLDLSEFVREQLPLLETIAGRQVSLRLSLTDALPLMEGDVHQLRQVMINLVTNAAESMEGAGTLGIRTGLVTLDRPADFSGHAPPDLAAGRYVFLEVQDSGAGMSADTVARIFDPFFSTKFPGRGLGMAAVWGIVRGHRGLIKVDSAPGKGSTFRLLFPVR